MGDEFNGDKKSRLDGIEEIRHVLANGHAHFEKEHPSTAQGQVLLAAAQRKTEERLALMAAAQQHTDERWRR